MGKIASIRAILTCLILACFVLTSCVGQSDGTGSTWQEQYDLGVRYLSEGSYEEAIIAFMAAIEIDPNRVEAYVDLAGTYEELGDMDHALLVLQDGYAVTGDATLQERIAEIEAAIAQITIEQIALELEPRVSELSVPFTVDEIVLGVSGIETAKSAYGDRPYALSNLMNDDTEDTVYVCFGYETPIPEGYEQDEFGFLFAGAPNDGPIHYIVIQDLGFICLGSLSIGDSSDDVFALFGLNDVSNQLYGTMTCSTSDERLLQYSGDPENFDLTYQENDKRVQINVTDGELHSIIMDLVGNRTK